MKGPFERLKYDLRRLWECPLCRRRERTDGSFTSRMCGCAAKGEGGRMTAMKLLEDGARRVDGRLTSPNRCRDAAVAEPAVATAATNVPAAAAIEESAAAAPLPTESI